MKRQKLVICTFFRLTVAIVCHRVENVTLGTATNCVSDPTESWVRHTIVVDVSELSWADYSSLDTRKVKLVHGVVWFTKSADLMDWIKTIAVRGKKYTNTLEFICFSSTNYTTLARIRGRGLR